MTEFRLFVTLPLERHGAFHAVVERSLLEPRVVLCHGLRGYLDGMVSGLR